MYSHLLESYVLDYECLCNVSLDALRKSYLFENIENKFIVIPKRNLTQTQEEFVHFLMSFAQVASMKKNTFDVDEPSNVERVLGGFMHHDHSSIKNSHFKLLLKGKYKCN